MSAKPLSNMEKYFSDFMAKPISIMAKKKLSSDHWAAYAEGE